MDVSISPLQTGLKYVCGNLDSVEPHGEKEASFNGKTAASASGCALTFPAHHFLFELMGAKVEICKLIVEVQFFCTK